MFQVDLAVSRFLLFIDMITISDKQARLHSLHFHSPSVAIVDCKMVGTSTGTWVDSAPSKASKSGNILVPSDRHSNCCRVTMAGWCYCSDRPFVADNERDYCSKSYFIAPSTI